MPTLNLVRRLTALEYSISRKKVYAMYVAVNIARFAASSVMKANASSKLLSVWK